MAALSARSAEQAETLRAVLHGGGAVLVGEAGVGKTALATVVAGEVAGRMGVVVRMVATAAARLTPFGALAPVLPAEMDTVHPALVPNLVGRRLRELAGDRPALLVVDDAQLLDEHSAAALLTLVTGRACRALVTVRADVECSDAVVALWKDQLLDRVDLGPLDRAGAREVLTARLGGEVASGTVELLWSHSRGNPLFLTELARFGAAAGRLRRDAGVWWWSGAFGVPPRLGELLAHRLDELSPAARDALDLLALGEPLPWSTLAAVVPVAALLEADRHGVVTAEEQAGELQVRFAHPLLHALAESRLTPARRRALSERLRGAPGRLDVVRRAGWEAGADDPDVGLLLAAADALLVSDPRTAARFAERALPHDPGPGAAQALAKAHAELGDAAAARRALDLAVERTRGAPDRLQLGFENISLALWHDRRPGRAQAYLAALRATSDATVADQLDSAEAQVALFGSRPADALRLADGVLGRDPAPEPYIRSLMVRMTALMLGDEPEAALVAADDLLEAMRLDPPTATRAGLAHALIAETRLFCGQDAGLPPSAGSSGRWPTAGPPDGPSAPAWPLLEGIRRHLEGNWPKALPALREAYVQQRAGEGLFRSEAVGGLIVVLAEAGDADEAADLLAGSPPDGIAVVPGLAGWAAAAVAAAQGRSTAAGELARDAARVAAQAGAVPTALWYLADAGRWGDPRAAAALAAELAPAGRSTLARVRLAGIRARGSGAADDLIAAAEAHLAAGLLGHAAELAEAGRSRSGAGTRAVRVLRAARAGLGVADTAAPPPDPAEAALTRREREIARMAARGLTDRDIAATLVVSVRTVESHLAAAYRKLGIRSRRELAEALPPRPGEKPYIVRGAPDPSRGAQ